MVKQMPDKQVKSHKDKKMTIRKINRVLLFVTYLNKNFIFVFRKHSNTSPDIP